MDSLIPRRGERALICGKTGSGKTVAMATLAGSLAEEARVAVIDCKIEPKYRALNRARLVRSPTNFFDRESRQEKREGPDILIWRPPPEVATDPAALDDALMNLYHRHRGAVFLDELYPFHRGTQAGPGLIALLTRGRSRGITTVMGSQRPKWVSRFCMSESEHYWMYRLADRDDRRRMGEVVPNLPDENPPKYHFRYYHQSLEKPLLFRPLPYRVPRISDSEIEQSLNWI